MRVPTAAIAAALTASPALAQTPSFMLIEPAAGQRGTVVTGISADGTAVSGYNSNNPYPASAFRWTASGGRDDFGLGSGVPSDTVPSGISGNGQFVVGRILAQQYRAFRWSSAGGFEDLGPAPASWTSLSTGPANGDGTAFVGNLSDNVSFRTAGFRWTQGGGYQVLPYLRPGSQFADAEGISRDGRVIVGASSTATRAEAWRWTPQGGVQELIPTVNPLFTDTLANAVSGNGAVIVGSGFVAPHVRHPFLWTEQSGMIDLGLPAGSESASASFTNFDGSVVVGWQTPIGQSSFIPLIWRADIGFVDFNQYLTSNGVVLPPDYVVGSVTGVSDDGMTFCGDARSISGLNPGEGFVATVPAPGTTGVILVGLVLSRRRAR
jgi:probable HAF family extracellular repeat protein